MSPKSLEQPAMSKNENLRLSQIATSSRLFEANQRQTSSARDVLVELWQHLYADAVYRYLCAIVKDNDVAEELSQDIWVSLLNGKFSLRRSKPWELSQVSQDRFVQSGE